MDLRVVEQAISCPFCGETVSLLVDLSAGSQRYVEDCQVCCRPMLVELRVDDGGDWSVQADCAS